MSLEVSPLLAYDTATTLAAAKDLHARAARPNLFIKIPGTPEGLPAIEEAIFAGVSINVTLLFSREQYVAAAQAYLRGIERRIAAGLDYERRLGGVGVHQPLGRCGCEQGAREPERQAGHRHRQAHLQGVSRSAGIARWKAIVAKGFNPQRLLLASTGTKDPKASDILYIKSLAAPDTVNTMPEATLLAFADHGEIGGVMPADGGDCEQVLAEFGKAGIDIDALAAQLQKEGAESFVKSWNDLMEVITSKSATLTANA